jgi:DNA modification methylase/transcriptional regulator with XRE-family HTH domain
MRSLPSDSVDCCVSSPPYWGLRSYIGDDDPNKIHELGLEPTPEEYVENMVAIFREVRRILKPTGSLWLNLGDSYQPHHTQRPRPNMGLNTRNARTHENRMAQGLKHKDLVGIPWRVAFALQADGWYLRSDVIWSKPNPMPESVTDRPTKSHEYLFLLTKASRYYFDADAVREPPSESFLDRWGDRAGLRINPKADARERNDYSSVPGESSMGVPANGRNIRSVWNIATRPYPGAHFAVFPPELPERCIKAGSSEKGVCPECGAPWERVSRPTDEYAAQSTRPRLHDLDREALRNYILERRKAMGLSQQQLDEAMGTNTAVRWWEGRNYLGKFTQLVPTWDLYQRLKDVLGLDDRFDDQVRRVDQNSSYRFRTERLSEKGPAETSAVTKRLGTAQRLSTGWRPSCLYDSSDRRLHLEGCECHECLPRTTPAVILDPFGGSGTVGMVANRLSRRAILIDLNPDYLKQQMERNAQAPLGLSA